MAIKIKRRNTGGALVIGTAPLTTGVGGIASGEPVYDAQTDILYIGKGDDGSGNSTAISKVGGGGAFLATALLAAASGVASLDATGKLPAAQLPASVTGAMVYQGVWNATTNTPALTSGAGTKGFFYKVSVAGTTTLDGTNNWNVGDSLHFDGTTWDKIDGPAEAVISVAGRIGAVTLTTADIGGFVAAAAAAAPVQTVAGRSGVVVLAVADVSGAAPIASPAFTGTPNVPTATAGTNTTQAASTAFIQAALTAFSPTAIDGGVI
jgi:hypothetical protein